MPKDDSSEANKELSQDHSSCGQRNRPDAENRLDERLKELKNKLKPIVEEPFTFPWGVWVAIVPLVAYLLWYQFQVGVFSYYGLPLALILPEPLRLIWPLLGLSVLIALSAIVHTYVAFGASVSSRRLKLEVITRVMGTGLIVTVLVYLLGPRSQMLATFCMGLGCYAALCFFEIRRVTGERECEAIFGSIARGLPEALISDDDSVLEEMVESLWQVQERFIGKLFLKLVRFRVLMLVGALVLAGWMYAGYMGQGHAMLKDVHWVVERRNEAGEVEPAAIVLDAQQRRLICYNLDKERRGSFVVLDYPNGSDGWLVRKRVHKFKWNGGTVMILREELSAPAAQDKGKVEAAPENSP